MRWKNALPVGLGLTACALLLVFIASERNGLLALVNWGLGGLAQIPQSAQKLAAYYAALPPAQLRDSMLPGALFGLVAALMWKARREWLIGSFVRAALFGVALGALGSQTFALVTQHCAFAPEADPLDAQLGIALSIAGSLCWLLVARAWANRGKRRAEGSGTFRSRWLPYALLAPTALNMLVFLYYPSVQAFTLSLYSRRFPLPQERFVCLRNYAALAADPIYQHSFAITAAITAAIVLLSLSLALGIAVLASQPIRGASIYRTLLVFPFALSPVVSGAIFLAMFRDGNGGLINAMLSPLTGATVGWLREPELAWIPVVSAAVWNILGFNILFYIAGLQTIPPDLLEAARIDGANRVQRFTRVTLPLLAPFTFFLLVTNIAYSFYNIYGVVDTLTGGGPPLGAAGSLGGATDVLIYKLYEDAFNPGSPAGLAAAQAVILFCLVAGITVLQFRTIDQRITYRD